MTDHHTAKRIEEFAGTFGPAHSEVIEILLVLAGALEGSPGGLDRLSRHVGRWRDREIEALDEARKRLASRKGERR